MVKDAELESSVAFPGRLAAGLGQAPPWPGLASPRGPGVVAGQPSQLIRVVDSGQASRPSKTKGRAAAGPPGQHSAESLRKRFCESAPAALSEP